ncbi:MAG: adenylate cyclase, partial [Verrucomicrobiota bacterium]
MHWLHRHRLWIIAGMCIFVTTSVLLLHFMPDVPFFSNVWRGEQNVEDLLRREGRKTPTRADFVFVGIDQNTLEFQPFDAAQVENNRALQLMAAQPFATRSREVWALLLDRLFDSGARLVVFDLIFGVAKEGDAEFRAALDRYRDKVVLGADFEFVGERDVGQQAKGVPPTASLIPAPGFKDDRVG